MADKKVSELDAIAGSATVADDLFLIVDASGSVTKKITRAELNNAIEQDVLSTVDINGGTIDSTVIGGATPAAGDFTTLGATGNITVGGTVDGRDVAADGTKLDGIEASATADQTDAEIRAAVEAASDSNVFTDADHTKLNGIATSATANPNAIDNVVEDTSPQLGGDLQSNGHDIVIADTDNIYVGTSNDGLKIHHSNNNSFIEDVGTGNFLITTNGNNIQLMKNQAEQMLVAKTDGSVELYYDNSKKLETASNGIDITGAFTATDGCTITTADNDPQLTLVSTDADANEGPILKFHRNSASPADNDLIGQLLFHGEDGAGNDQQYANIQSIIMNNAQGNEDGRLTFRTLKAGTATSRLDISNAETVFNDSSVDVDFRVESLGDANSFVVEGATKGIGMGTNDPTIDSSLAGVSVPGGARVLHIHDSDGAYLKLTDPATGSNRGAQFGLVGTNAILNNCESGNLIFGTGNTERMRLSTGALRIGQSSTDHPGSGNSTAGIGLRTNGDAFFSDVDSEAIYGNRNNEGGVVSIALGGTAKGGISVSSSAVAFNTTSDRRLKSNIQDAASASDKIDALQVRQFNWNVDGSHQDFGLIAQELQPIAPTAVLGDADSDEMMSVDYSKLVPMLIKEIQELRSRVAALEAS